MAFSKDFELEIDSAFRIASSASSSDFEFQLPYSFPTVKGQTQITLTNAFIPESFYNIPFDVVLTAAGPSFTIPKGRYSPSQLATTITSLATAAGLTTFSCTYSSTTGKFTFSDSASTYTLTLSSPSAFFNWLGFNGTPSFIQITSGSPKISDNYAGMNFERERRVYLRINTFESKIMMPQTPSQIFTFGIPLFSANQKGDFVFEVSESRLAQTLYLSSNQLRSNSYLKIQLVWQDGTIIDLNGRNWKVALRIEQEKEHYEYME
jgi:hypothetical protein